MEESWPLVCNRYKYEQQQQNKGVFMIKTIKQIVLNEVKAQVEVKGQDWLLALGYRECNDYAEILKAQLMAKNNEYYRFETVARYVREHKECLRIARERNAANTVPTVTAQ
jgi:hypothetical protein